MEMTDMLVRLYDLPTVAPPAETLKAHDIVIRRALASEKSVALAWVGGTFNKAWASECDVAFSNRPISCYVAIKNGTLVGFACYDSICRDFFGPTAVTDAHRGLGIGKALLLKCLYSMKEQGYAYAIIGGVGPTEFYAKAVGATVIDGSDPGIYRGLLK